MTQPPRLPQPLRRFFKLPKTLWGFPVEDDGLSTAADRAHMGRRGIALLIAIMIISVMMLFTTDLILSSQVNMSLASQNRDNLKAEYMAKSAMNIGTLLLTADFAYDLFTAQQNPKAVLNDSPYDMWSAMNGWPIGGETGDMLASFQEQLDLNSVLDSGIMDQLKLFDGHFVLNVMDESQKINLNYCFQTRCTETLAMLEALFSCPAEKMFLEQKKVSGSELTYRIKDWVDQDSKAEEGSGYNDENEPYNKRLPKMNAKNAPLDTLDELRLIEGWDEDVHAVFSPYVTAFPMAKRSTDKVSKTNLNSASRELLQCLFPEARGDCAEKSAQTFRDAVTKRLPLVADGKDVASALRDTFCYTGGGTSDGVATNRASWFAQNSMVFRIETEGVVGNSTKKLIAIVERQMPDIKKGEKISYKILYLKVI